MKPWITFLMSRSNQQLVFIAEHLKLSSEGTKLELAERIGKSNEEFHDKVWKGIGGGKMVKTTYYRYECLVCGYIVTRSNDVGEMGCPACKTEKEFVEGKGNFGIARLEEEIQEIRNMISEIV